MFAWYNAVLSKFVGPVGQSDIFYECPTKNVRVSDQMSGKNINIDVCKTLMPPSPTYKKRRDLWPWPTDLNINRGHLLIKDYLPTKFEASGAKHSWVISCTRWSRLAWPLTLTSDLLTWVSIGVFFSSRTIYLPSLKLLGQSILELSVAQGEVDWHDLWPWPLTYWPEYQ